MGKEKLNIWDLRGILTSYEDGTFEYIVNDYQKDNYGQPVLTLQEEKDGKIYAFVEGNDGVICLCEIESKEHLLKLKEILLGR